MSQPSGQEENADRNQRSNPAGRIERKPIKAARGWLLAVRKA
jgi:hypothetical protein